LKHNYNPPYSGILLLIAFVNIIFSTYFISLFLTGVVFKIFLVSFKKEHYYILAFSILTFLVIEVVQGFKPFSLTIISLFLYYFIIPRIKHTFSSSIISEFIFIFLFYVCLFVSILFYSVFKIEIVWILVYNFIIDIILVGLLI